MEAHADQQPTPADDGSTTPQPGQRLLSPQDLADYLEVPVNTLYTWRHRNTGPRSFRIGKHLRYRWNDVQSWLDRQIAESS